MARPGVPVAGHSSFGNWRALDQSRYSVDAFIGPVRRCPTAATQSDARSCIWNGNMDHQRRSKFTVGGDATTRREVLPEDEYVTRG